MKPLKPLIFILLIVTTSLIYWPFSVEAKTTRFGESLCQHPDFQCVEVQAGDSWKSLWPEAEVREKIRRINRLNVRLQKGMTVAVPKSLKETHFNYYSFLPDKLETGDEKLLLVDLNKMAWGAYDAAGNLKNWGPAVGGKSYCPDVGYECTTRTGEFRIYRKGGAGCKSRKFPIPNGGAPMPYCMFYEGGYALHGSYSVPGYHASHGCVRIYPEDAAWLSQEFVEAGDGALGFPGTKVMIEPYEPKL